MGVINVPFANPNVRIENPEAIAIHGSDGPIGLENSPWRSRSSRSWPSWPPGRGRDPKDFLLEVIGPPAGINAGDLRDTWNPRRVAERYPVDTGRLRRVVETVARDRAGQEAAEGARVGIAGHYVSVATSRRSWSRRRRQGCL